MHLVNQYTSREQQNRVDILLSKLFLEYTFDQYHMLACAQTTCMGPGFQNVVKSKHNGVDNDMLSFSQVFS